MKVLHVNNIDLHGRRFNGYDLIRELASRGISGKQAVVTKLSDSADVVELLDLPDDAKIQRAVTVVERRHSLSNLLYPWGKVLAETPEFKDADVVHYHLPHNNVVSVLDLPMLFALKPSVWTFHDPWALTGHCIYPQQCGEWLHGCERCQHLDAPFAITDDRAGQMWRIKQSILADADVDVVVASEFMLDMVQRSPLTAHLEKVHLIPFGIDADVFPHDDERAASRRTLGIPEDDFVVMFRSTQTEFKGLRYIVDALGLRPPSGPTTLLTVDRSGLVDVLSGDYNVVEMGWVNDESLYPLILSACDVMLMPSTAEAFGLMALEAMAAGRPVISFEGTSLPGVTYAPECGLSVPMGDVEALRVAVDTLRDPVEAGRRGRLGRELVGLHYTHERYLDAMASLYREVLEASTGG